MKLADPGIARVAIVTTKKSAAGTGARVSEAAHQGQVLGSRALVQQRAMMRKIAATTSVVDHLQHRAVGAT